MSVIIYTTRFCPFCIRAKQLLDTKSVAYQEVAVDGDSQLRQKMTEQCGRRTVPQIWINQQHIGGCDDLMALEHSAQLDRLLK